MSWTSSPASPIAHDGSGGSDERAWAGAGANSSGGAARAPCAAAWAGAPDHRGVGLATSARAARPGDGRTLTAGADAARGRAALPARPRLVLARDPAGPTCPARL